MERLGNEMMCGPTETKAYFHPKKKKKKTKGKKFVEPNHPGFFLLIQFNISSKPFLTQKLNKLDRRLIGSTNGSIQFLKYWYYFFISWTMQPDNK